MNRKIVEMCYLRENEVEDIFECPRCRTQKSVPRDCDAPLCECDPELLKANYKPNIKVFWEIETRTEGEFYEDDYGHEFQSSPTISRRIEIEKRHTSEIQNILNEEDGDYDFSQTIHLITDLKGKILFNPQCKIATYHDNWELYTKWKEEKDPFRKAEYSEKLINGIQERQTFYGKERDRKEKHFVEWCKYFSQEEVNERRDNEGDSE